MQELRDKIVEDNLVNRRLMINCVIDDSLIDLVVMQILKFNEEDDHSERVQKNFDRTQDPIKIFINSPGGKVIPSLSLVSAMETSRTPVFTYAMGQAASAAAVILLAGHRRFCQPYSTIMIHEMSGGVHGTLQDTKEWVADTATLQTMYDHIITKNTKIKPNQLKECYTHKRDWTFTSTEALKYKIVDELF